MSTPPSIEEYVAHLRALEEMPPGVAQALRDKLLQERAWIESQLAMVEAALERAGANGTAVPRPQSEAVRSGDAQPEKRATRRQALLGLMSSDPDKDWSTAEMRG